nr:PqiC family protein [Solimonas sp. SE-A11]
MSAPSAAAPVAPTRWIDVQAVTVPLQLDTPQLVVRQGDASLALLERQQWASPLDAEIRGALVTALGAQGVRDIHALPPPADTPLHRLKLELQAFETMPGRAVRWEGVWSLRGTGGAKASLTCAFSAQEPVGTQTAEMVAGHQRLLSRLAGQIAAAMAQAAAPACPGN